MPEMTSVFSNTGVKRMQLLESIRRKKDKDVAAQLAAIPDLANADIGLTGGAETTPLAAAAEIGHVPTVRALLAAKADVNSTKSIPCRCCNKFIVANALFLAATQGHYSVVRLLLEQDGVQLKGANRDGDPALLIIARNHFWHGHKIVAALLENNLADPNKPNATCWARHRRCDYKYPITQALMSGNQRITALLLQHGASLATAYKSLHQSKPRYYQSPWYFDAESRYRGLRVLEDTEQRQKSRVRAKPRAAT